jgi:hypothetical protein
MDVTMSVKMKTTELCKTDFVPIGQSHGDAQIWGQMVGGDQRPT